MKSKAELALELEKLEQRNNELAAKLTARTPLSTDEETELRGMTASITKIKSDMDLATAADEAAARAAGNDFDKQNPEKRNPANRRRPEHETLAERYDVGRAMRSAARQLHTGEDDGLEREMSEQGRNELRASGVQVLDKPSIFVPDDAIKRSNTTTPADAGILIEESQRQIAEGVRAKLFLEDLGLVVDTALPGQNNVPVLDYVSRGHWVGESDAARAAIPAALREATLTAKMLEVPTLNSWYLQAMAGKSGAVLSQTMLQAEAETIDATLITRGSSTVAPKGIMDMDAYSSVASPGIVEFGGANGKAFTYDDLIDMVNSPDMKASGSTNPAWITSPYMRAIFQKMKLDTGSGQFVWDRRDMNLLLSYKAAVTTLVPTNATRGTSSGTVKPIIFGHFGNALVVLRWPVRQIIVDPFTDPNGTKTRSISFIDWAAKNPQAIARGYATN